MFREIDSLDRIIEKSKGSRLLIFKHSSACPISGRGRLELENFLADHPELEAYLVVVQNQRPLSNEIEAKLGVRHETPQLLLVVDGRVSLFWSHYQISKKTLEAELI